MKAGAGRLLGLMGEGCLPEGSLWSSATWGGGGREAGSWGIDNSFYWRLDWRLESASPCRGRGPDPLGPSFLPARTQRKKGKLKPSPPHPGGRGFPGWSDRGQREREVEDIGKNLPKRFRVPILNINFVLIIKAIMID